MRARNPQIKDPTPTLVDIERTHILFMNAHFKPFAAIGYEYNKVAVQSGSARLNSEVQFSIPQFGDFFHDMVLHVKLGAVDAINADYWTDSAANEANGSELLRYCDYLGQRLLKKVKFTVNGNPLDEYDSDVLNMHQKFFVTPNKEVGWKRNVGQEVAKQGYVDFQAGRNSGARESRQVLDGPQTAKPTQGVVDMWIPLLFWFNRDPRLAIPSVSIPYGQRFIDIQFAAANEILQHVHASNPANDASVAVPTPDVTTAELYINNIFVNPEIHDIFIKRIGFSLIRVHRRQVIRTNKQNDNLLLNQLKWPIETLYVGLRPSANVDTASSGMLENWHLYSEVTDSNIDGAGTKDYAALLFQPGGLTIADVDAALSDVSASGRALETIETITGLVNTTVLTPNILNEFLAFYGFETVAASDTDYANVAAILADWPMPQAQIPTAVNVGTAMVTAGAGAGSSALRYKSCTPTMDTINIEAHGVPLYRDIPAPFFNSYTPFAYGGQHIRTPDDCGVHMIPFNLYPGSYQPSGHVNISRAREFYLAYTSSNVGSSVANADLVVV